MSNDHTPDQSVQADAGRMKQKASALSAALRDLRDEVELQRAQQEQAGEETSISYVDAIEKLDRMSADLEDAVLDLAFGVLYHRGRLTVA